MIAGGMADSGNSADHDPNQDYITPGTYSFIVPNGVSSVTVRDWGGGGGGGYGTGYLGAAGGGGGGGAYASSVVSVTAGSSYAVQPSGSGRCRR